MKVHNCLASSSSIKLEKAYALGVYGFFDGSADSLYYREYFSKDALRDVMDVFPVFAGDYQSVTNIGGI